MKNKTIVLKKLRNNLTSEEEVVFQKWVEKSHINRLFYNYLLRLKNEGSGAFEISELETDTAWRSIQEKVKQKKKSKVIPFYKRKVMRYAAANVIKLRDFHMLSF